MPGPIHPSNIGGGRVVRTFTNGLISDKALLAGTTLTREQILKMPSANRNALIEKGYMMVWPPSSDTLPAAVAPRADATAGATPHQRFVRPRGFGKYDVIEGVQLNDRPLSKDEAYPLAGLQVPEERKSA